MGIDYDVLLSNLWDRSPGLTPELMELLSRQALKSSGIGRPFVQGLEAIESGQSMPELLSDDPQRMGAQSAIAGREAEESLARIEAAKERSETERMQTEAMDRSLDPLTWAGGGGPDSGKQYPADKLFAIREQAKAMGGGEGISVPGGSFSQMTDSPEALARIAERDEWAAGQPERNLEFAMSPAEARRNPAYAATAADKLTQLQNQNQEARRTDIAERKTANQEALIGSLTQSGGKIPFETAMKLDLAGLEVPTFAIGKSPAAAKNELSQLKRQTMQSINDAAMEGLPDNVVAYLHYILASIPELEGQLSEGGDPDQILATIYDMINRHADESGARAIAEQRAAAMKAAQEVK